MSVRARARADDIAPTPKAAHVLLFCLSTFPFFFCCSGEFCLVSSVVRRRGCYSCFTRNRRRRCRPVDENPVRAYVTFRSTFARDGSRRRSCCTSKFPLLFCRIHRNKPTRGEQLEQASTPTERRSINATEEEPFARVLSDDHLLKIYLQWRKRVPYSGFAERRVSSRRRFYIWSRRARENLSVTGYRATPLTSSVH